MGFGFITRDIGIDLGTANTLVYVKGKDILINEPSVVAINEYTKQVLAVGKAAKEMVGRTPGDIRAIKPLKDGVISDFDMTQIMLKEFIKMAMQGKSVFTKVRMVIGVPSGVTEVEKRAVEEVAHQLGANQVFILEEPMAAAIGAGLAVSEPYGNMVVDIGGGTTDIAVVSLGGIVTSTSLRIAGDEMDEAIIQYIRRKYQLWIGERTAEELKIGIGCAYIPPDHPELGEQTVEIRGRDMVSGLPKTIQIKAYNVLEALEEPVTAIVEAIKTTLEATLPELSADIIDSGMVLTGGGSLLTGLDKLIEKETGISTRVAENALEAVAMGTGMSLNNIEVMQKYSSRGRKYSR